MGNIGLILSDEAYYGFRLSGLSHCFLATDLSSIRRAIFALKTDKGVSLVIIEKGLKDVLTKEERLELDASDYPLFFEFDKNGMQTYNEEITSLIRELGITVDGS
jgi:vacuolar-type H+-ATPase subunit F/Vma7